MSTPLDILLLDEPTTGLDSFNAHSIVSILADLAQNQGRIVLMSVHQPRSDVFTLFDRIGLLSHGHLVYFGPRECLVSHFSSLGYPCPTYANPLDFCGEFCHAQAGVPCFSSGLMRQEDPSYMSVLSAVNDIQEWYMSLLKCQLQAWHPHGVSFSH